jgi:hypothetical protein
MRAAKDSPPRQSQVRGGGELSFAGLGSVKPRIDERDGRETPH